MSENNLPKEIVDKIDMEAKKACPYLDDNNSYYKEWISAFITAALHYSQIIEEKDKEIAVIKENYEYEINKWRNSFKDLDASCEHLESQIEGLKAENERLKEVLAVKESLELMLENQKLQSQIKGLVGELERIYKTYGYQYTKEILTNYYNSIK